MWIDGRDLSITCSVQAWHTKITYEHKMSGRNYEKQKTLKVIPFPSATQRCVLAPELIVLGDCLTIMFVDFENDSSFTVFLFISSRLRLLNVCPRTLYAVVYLTMLSVNQLHAIKQMKNHVVVSWPRIESHTFCTCQKRCPCTITPSVFRHFRKIAKSDYLLRYMCH